MTEKSSPDVPSLLLPDDVLRSTLVEGLAAVGAIGGLLGGGLPGGHGGAAGARVGAKLFTKVKGIHRVLSVPAGPQAEAALASLLGPGRPVAATTADGQPLHDFAGVVGSGLGGLNPAVVQTRWRSPRELEVTSHGLEGLIDQKTAAKALARLEVALGLRAED